MSNDHPATRPPTAGSFFDVAKDIVTSKEPSPVTEGQIAAYLRAKCVEFQNKAGGRYVSLEINCRLLQDNAAYLAEWIAYIEGGDAGNGKTSDCAIAYALDAFSPNERAAKLRAEIAERQAELAKLEGEQ